MPLIQNNTYQVCGKKTKLAIWRFWQKLVLKQQTRRSKGFFLLRLEVDAGSWLDYSSWVSLKKVEASPRQIGQVRFVCKKESEWVQKNARIHLINSYEMAVRDLLFLSPLHVLRMQEARPFLSRRLFLLNFSFVFNICFNRRGDQISLFVFKWVVSFLWGSEGGREEVNFKFGMWWEDSSKKGAVISNL